MTSGSNGGWSHFTKEGRREGVNTICLEGLKYECNGISRDDSCRSIFLVMKIIISKFSS